MDIAIVLDNSNVVEEGDFRILQWTALRIVSDLYEHFDMTQNDTRISVLRFALQPVLLLPLNGEMSEFEVKRYIESVKHISDEAANYTSLLYALGW